MNRKLEVDFEQINKLGLTVGEPECLAGCRGATGGLVLDCFVGGDVQGSGREYAQASILFASDAPDKQLRCIVLHNAETCEKIEIHPLVRQYLASVAVSAYEQKVLMREIALPILSAMNFIARGIEDNGAAANNFKWEYEEFVKVLDVMGYPIVAPGRCV